jgi:hypothetical protein
MKRERAVYDNEDDPEPVRELKDLAELEKGLQIDEDDLDQALLHQPDLFYRVAKAYAILNSRKDAAKQNVLEAEAMADLEIRTAYEKQKRREDDDKRKSPTAPQIAAEVRLNVKVRRAINDMLQLSSAAAQYAALKEAYEQRSYALKELCNLASESAYSNRSYGPREDALNRRADQNRRDMAEARRRR